MGITDIQQLPADDKAHLFALMDAFLRDHKAKKSLRFLKYKKPLNVAAFVSQFYSKYIFNQFHSLQDSAIHLL